MKYDITSDACRVCLRKSSSCRSIFLPLTVGDVAPNVKLNLISGVSVLIEKDDTLKLPKSICKQCEISVNMAYNIRNRARKSDQILSFHCNKLNRDNIIVELENGRKFKLSKELTLKVVPKNEMPLSTSIPKQMEEVTFEKTQIEDDNIEYEGSDHDDDDDHNCNESVKVNNNIDEYDNEDYNNDIKDDGMQSFSESEEIPETEPQSTSFLKHEPENELNPINEKKFPCSTDHEPEIKAKPIYSAEEIAKKLQASNQYELVSWKQEDDENAVTTFRLRVKEETRKNVSKDFICDICGNSYSQKHRLMEHMRRHNKEKSFACEICGKCFAVSEGLRRHILTHGGLRPFKCNQCTRSFYTPSARRAHERVHSGAKPFVCNVCAKAFAYTCSLRKHMLIHQNVKLYRCEYCDKEFRLQHHMKQHEETQIHKDAVAECVRAGEINEFLKL